MLAHFVAMSVGLCWRMLAYLAAMWTHLVATLAYVGLMLTHVELKDPKNGNSKKTLQNAECFDGRRPILGLCWPILGLCWPILGLCWPSLGLCWPILGLCWPILGAMLAHLGAMLAHLEAYVGPC